MKRSTDMTTRQSIGLWGCAGYSLLLTITFIAYSVQQNHTMNSLDQKYSRQLKAMQVKIDTPPQNLNADSISVKTLLIEPYNGKQSSGSAYMDSNGLVVKDGSGASTYIHPGMVDVVQGETVRTLRP